MNKRFEYKLYASDDTVLDTVTGKNLSNTADSLDPYMVAYHFLQKLIGLHNS